MIEAYEKCGVAGVYLSKQKGSASKILYKLLLQLYHRGHEGAGIVCYDRRYGIKSRINGIENPYKDIGRVRDVFKEGRIAEKLMGDIAIGHTRYGTVGLHKPELYLQPIRSPNGEFYIAHNGTITPCELQNLSKKFKYKDAFDTQILAALIETELNEKKDWRETLESVSKYLDGSYTCTILTKDGKLIGIREPRGLKPLNYGEIDGGYAIASETSALEAIGAKNISPVQPGELVVVEDGELKKERFAEQVLSRCSFEYIYFSSVASKFDGISCWTVRLAAGKMLAKKYPVDADYVAPVPDAGRPSAIGFSQESGIPYTEALTVNREVGRVFILPEERREEALKQKYLPIRDVISGKRVVVLDDSIVRGDTVRSVVKILRNAGAKEVHVRITYYPIIYPCIGGGIAFARRDKLAMNKFNGVEGIRKYINADSLAFLSQEELEEIGLKNCCFSCGNGNYPFKEPERQLAVAECLGYVG